MLVAVDADHREDRSVGGAVLFRTFDESAPEAELLAEVPPAAPYVPGQLYLRELPAILAALGAVRGPIELVIVDGYVWLGDSRPGLGAHLHRALGSRVPVIGVAKTPYRGGDRLAVPVRRGRSEKPLFVSAVGVDLREAAEWIRTMHGEHRLPTLLRRADRLCREGRARGALRTDA